MEEQVIGFDVAVLAKKKGFLEVECRHYYDKDSDLVKANYYESDVTNRAIDNDSGYFNSAPFCVAPTQSLLQKWLREVHGWQVNVDREDDYWKPVLIEFKSGNKYRSLPIRSESFEAVIEAGLQEVLKTLPDANL